MRPTTTRVATPAAIAATSLVLNERCMIAGGPWLMRSVSKRRKQRRNAFLLGRIRQPPGGASRLQAQFNFACQLAGGCKTESTSVPGDVVGDLNEIRQTRNRRLGGEEPSPEILELRDRARQLDLVFGAEHGK